MRVRSTACFDTGTALHEREKHLWMEGRGIAHLHSEEARFPLLVHAEVIAVLQPSGS